jgi:hypothetical protein
MLYITRHLLVFSIAAQAALSAAEINFDAEKDTKLPGLAAASFTNGPDAEVVLFDKKLRITTGSGANSARAAISLPPTKRSKASDAVKTRELKLNFEPFTGRSEKSSRVGLWAGFASSQTGAESIYSVSGNWVGIVLELKESTDGNYQLLLIERWATSPAGQSYTEVGIFGEYARTILCETNACPTDITIKVESALIQISFSGAEVVALGKGAEGLPRRSWVKKPLQAKMTDVFKSDLATAIGFANYGSLPGASVLLVNRFSIKD